MVNFILLMKKTSLVILDGWGHGLKNNGNAIFNANTPYIDSLYKLHPNTELKTHGTHVGLPKNQMGNSEVGHLNIGAGRIVYQDLEKINQEISSDKIKENKTLIDAITKSNTHNRPLHIMGLLSDGGIHSHINHLKAICNIAIEHNINKIFIHIFTDGRDSDPQGGIGYISDILDYINNKNITIASVIGRYYSMDRDKRWERTSLAYNMLAHGEGKKTNNILESIQDSYNQGKTDEFILPIINTDSNNNPITTIQSGDTVICFNFRSDRCRQLIAALTQIEIPQYNIKSLDIHLYTMTKYDDSFDNIKVFYPKKDINNTIGHVLEKEKLTQLRIAETEKYPHVTFFFSGGQEKKMEGETRIMISSSKVPTYDLKPDMSAGEITTSYINAIQTKKPSFVCLNYANPDMVGHTGNYEAVKKAIETIDTCLKELIEASIKEDYALVIIADHGNAEKMKNKDGTPNTAHTKNKVPCFILNANVEHIKEGSLCDIAPTILKIMDIKKPNEMTGKAIIN